MNDASEPTSTSGGGIVRGGSRPAATSSEKQSLPEFIRALRRRWPTGVAVVTIRETSGAMRGVAVSSLMMLALEPPSMAFALATSGSFQEFLTQNVGFVVSILDLEQEFISERFAGRAPVPDADLSGIPFDLVTDGLPVLRGSLAWCCCRVSNRQTHGDHVLIVADILEGSTGIDSDDPLLSYEGQYRGLEMR